MWSPAELSSLLRAPWKGLLALLRCWENPRKLVGAAPEPQGNAQCSPSLGCCFAELLSREGKINPCNLWIFFKAENRFGPSCFCWRAAFAEHRHLKVTEQTEKMLGSCWSSGRAEGQRRQEDAGDGDLARRHVASRKVSFLWRA